MADASGRNVMINASAELRQGQKLSQTMIQNIKILQLSSCELEEKLLKESEDNPLIDYDIPFEFSDFYRCLTDEDDSSEFDTLTRNRTYSEHLYGQLGEMRDLDPTLHMHCRYIVGNLNSQGYLDCSLEELSQASGISTFDLEQALYCVQCLDPPGTGARSLSECLILQLERGSDFNAYTVRASKYGLELIAMGKYDDLASLIGASKEQARKTAKIIRGLNPIPSSGFFDGRGTPFVTPECRLVVDDGKIMIENYSGWPPRLSLNSYYSDLMKSPDYPEVRAFLQDKYDSACQLISGVEYRQSSINAVLNVIISHQQGFLLRGEPMSPLTMAQVAEILGIDTSTVSRTVKGKYVLVNNQLLPIRLFFTSSVSNSTPEASSSAVKNNIERFIREEDKGKPLTDSVLTDALHEIGINVSRRTVAKYRSELNIPSASLRKKDESDCGFLRR